MKGHFNAAADHYIKAISGLRWLDVKVDMDANPFDDSKKLIMQCNPQKFTQDPKGFTEKMEQKLMESLKDSSKEEAPKQETTEIPKETQKDTPEYFEERYQRLLLTTYHDGNVTYMNGQDIPSDDLCHLLK